MVTINTSILLMYLQLKKGLAHLSQVFEQKHMLLALDSVKPCNGRSE